MELRNGSKVRAVTGLILLIETTEWPARKTVFKNFEVFPHASLAAVRGMYEFECGPETVKLFNPGGLYAGGRGVA